MKKLTSCLLALILLLSIVITGCDSSGNSTSSNTSNQQTVTVSESSSSDTSSVTVIPIEPPKVKSVIAEIKDGGTGTTATDSLSNAELAVTPPDYATNGGFVHNDLSDGSTLLTVSSTNENEYSLYLESLKTIGYIEVMADRKIVETDNKASVFTNGKYLISTNFIPSTDTAKIAIDELGLDSVDKVNKYLSIFDRDFSAKSNITEPLFISLGLSVSEDKNAEGYYNTGLSYVLRLSDGSFIIIDGGDITSTNDHSGRLLSVLKHYAPDPDNIRIAAWIITHPHSDHAKAFTEFYGNYINNSTDVTLEKIIANIPNYDTAVAATSEGQILLNSTLRSIFKQSKANGTDMYKAHTGQVYNLCGVTVEMLYTYDVTIPKKMVKGMDNTFSLCFNIYFEGKTIQITGDGTYVNIEALNSMYSENLKCDIVQVTHHGTISNFKSSSDPDKQAHNFEQLTKYYTDYTKPEYAIWPSTKRGLDYYLGLDATENPNAILKTILSTDSIYANGHNVKEFKFTDGKLTVKEYEYSSLGYSK